MAGQLHDKIHKLYIDNSTCLGAEKETRINSEKRFLGIVKRHTRLNMGFCLPGVFGNISGVKSSK